MICENRRTSCSKLGMINGGGKTLTGTIYHLAQQCFGGLVGIGLKELGWGLF